MPTNIFACKRLSRLSRFIFVYVSFQNAAKTVLARRCPSTRALEKVHKQQTFLVGKLKDTLHCQHSGGRTQSSAHLDFISTSLGRHTFGF